MLAKRQPMQSIIKYRAFMAEAEDETLLRTLSLKKLPSILGNNDLVNELKSKFFKQKQDIEVPESKRLALDVDRIKKVLCDYYNIDEDQLYYKKRAFFNEARAIGVYLSTPMLHTNTRKLLLLSENIYESCQLSVRAGIHQM